MLKLETFGAETEPFLLIAHGLFGSGRNWRVIAKKLSADLQVATVDMRNHGHSFRSPDMSYETMAADLAEVIERIGAPAMVLGHSMGGKAAMMLALTRPELVERLIVADIAPIKYDHSHAHFIDAMRAVDLGLVTKRSDVGDQLSQMVDDPALRAFFMQSIEIKDGKAQWLLNLDVLAEAMDNIIGWPMTEAVHPGPTLFLAGSDSDYISPDGRKAAKALFPDARFAKIKSAGHWLHADQPAAFTETVRGYVKH